MQTLESITRIMSNGVLKLEEHPALLKALQTSAEQSFMSSHPYNFLPELGKALAAKFNGQTKDDVATYYADLRFAVMAISESFCVPLKDSPTKNGQPLHFALDHEKVAQDMKNLNGTLCNLHRAHIEQRKIILDGVGTKETHSPTKLLASAIVRTLPDPSDVTLTGGKELQATKTRTHG